MIGADAFSIPGVSGLPLSHCVTEFQTISPYREFTEAGGLLSYGGSIAEGHARQAFTWLAFSGERDRAELPVEQVVKLDLVVNMATAKALGLDVPSHMQQRADAIIE